MSKFKPGTQNDDLLQALRHGPMTNWEIVHKLRMLKHTSRISDLRKAGYTVVSKNEGNGKWTYYLCERINQKFFEERVA